MADYCSDDQTYLDLDVSTSVQIDDDVDSARTMSFFVYKRSNIIDNRIAGDLVQIHRLILVYGLSTSILWNRQGNIQLVRTYGGLRALFPSLFQHKKPNA